DGRGDEAALLEEVRRAGGEHEDALQTHRTRAGFEGLEQRLTATALAVGRVDRDAVELAHSLLFERFERSAADHEAVAVEHHEVLNLHLEALPAPPDQDPLLLERLKQRGERPDVLDA